MDALLKLDHGKARGIQDSADRGQTYKWKTDDKGWPDRQLTYKWTDKQTDRQMDSEKHQRRNFFFSQFTEFSNNSKCFNTLFVSGLH